MRYKNSDDNRYRVQFMRSTEELMDQLKADYRIPYKDCVYRMYGEDDARAWARMVIELAS